MLCFAACGAAQAWACGRIEGLEELRDLPFGAGVGVETACSFRRLNSAGSGGFGGTLSLCDSANLSSHVTVMQTDTAVFGLASCCRSRIASACLSVAASLTPAARGKQIIHSSWAIFTRSSPSDPGRDRTADGRFLFEIVWRKCQKSEKSDTLHRLKGAFFARRKSQCKKQLTLADDGLAWTQQFFISSDQNCFDKWIFITNKKLCVLLQRGKS